MHDDTTGGDTTAVGAASRLANTTGNFSTAIGYRANVQSGDLFDATAIGNDAIVDASRHVRIGDTQITQIGGEVGWSALSDVRAKTKWGSCHFNGLQLARGAGLTG